MQNYLVKKQFKDPMYPFAAILDIKNIDDFKTTWRKQGQIKKGFDRTAKSYIFILNNLSILSVPK